MRLIVPGKSSIAGGAAAARLMPQIDFRRDGRRREIHGGVPAVTGVEPAGVAVVGAATASSLAVNAGTVATAAERRPTAAGKAAAGR